MQRIQRLMALVIVALVGAESCSKRLCPSRRSCVGNEQQKGSSKKLGVELETLEDPLGRFSVELPGDPEENNSARAVDGGQAAIQSFFVEFGGRTAGIVITYFPKKPSKNHLPVWSLLQRENRLLQKLREPFLKILRFRLLLPEIARHACRTSRDGGI